jgi:hypothetical protein
MSGRTVASLVNGKASFQRLLLNEVKHIRYKLKDFLTLPALEILTCHRSTTER